MLPSKPQRRWCCMFCEVNEDKSEFDKTGVLFAGLRICSGRQGGPNTRKVAEVLPLSVPRSEREQQSSPIKRIVSGRCSGQKFGAMARVIQPDQCEGTLLHVCTCSSVLRTGVYKKQPSCFFPYSVTSRWDRFDVQATGDGARKCRHVLYFLRPSTPSIDAGSSRPVIASPTPINTSLERQTQPKPEAGKFTTLITLHVRGNPLTESYDVCSAPCMQKSLETSQQVTRVV
ncbi:uncharacterized protein CIMG_05562 [Coccidioides immitis RS]|uniref:Uncharacterized protein n=1 Tax=Coccidioides immitis (strain RS) TaxID=246410 RepID=J3KFV2_COCIM|nr:uncharacterized protein CIMG_05562 [Coccidioides immitis RS]EAS34538.3 hypothetical protein CIMG_05562 [Coccidioides immitis RS]